MAESLFKTKKDFNDFLDAVANEILLKTRTNEIGKDYTVIVPMLKRELNGSVFPIILNRYTIHGLIYDDFYDYKGKKNDREAIKAHLDKYAQSIISIDKKIKTNNGEVLSHMECKIYWIKDATKF